MSRPNPITIVDPDRDTLRLEAIGHRVLVTNTTKTDLIAVELTEEDARKVFAWLGVWLHTL